MLDESGEKMAAKETMQTICNLRERVKTWYGGGGGSCFSRLKELEEAEDVGDGRFLSSWAYRLGDKVGLLELLLEWIERSVTMASFLSSSGFKDIMGENKSERFMSA